LKNENYNIGLDIGTSSIGFAVTDEFNKLARVKGKNYIGVRLFEEGETAAERRQFRTTRRRLGRRKWRLGLLEEIFAPYIAKADPYFLARLKSSNISPKDTNKKFIGSILFPNETDTAFYAKYPTIYHLRKALMTEDKKFDIREIYLAIHHIVKYRGNFLVSTSISNFKQESVDFTADVSELNESFMQIHTESKFEIDTAKVQEISQLLLDNKITRMDRQKQVANVLAKNSGDKEADKINKKIATEFCKAVLGNKAKFNVILGEDAVDSDWSFKMDDENSDEEIEILMGQTNGQQQNVLRIIHQWYSQITLNGIVPDGQMISESMIDKYELHRKHLLLLKQQIKVTKDKKKAQQLHEAYEQYVHGTGAKKKLTQDDFYSKVTKNLETSDFSDEIKKQINAETFMPKQRTSANGVIPHQLHQQELDKIIEKQAKYYPFLAELNPDTKRQNIAKYKLDELIAFKIPYYVGPLITTEDQKKTSGKSFAWMVRKEPGKITPWNFDQKVDKMASADQFIRRMTTKDSYLITEDVLPAESLIYQKYKVLNELNMIRVNGNKLTKHDKQNIYQQVFEKYKTVNVKKIQNYFLTDGRYQHAPKITGLSDDNKFNSNLSTYIDFKKIFQDVVDDPQKQKDFERIIEWSTIFEDRHIYEVKLKEISWLNDEQRKELKKKRHQGWGRLSAKLLTGIFDENGYSIMDQLWNTQKNFMQIQAEEGFNKKIQAENSKHLEKNDFEDILEDAYTSPQNKKAIRQVIKVVEDIQKAMGTAPQKISIEFTRSADKNPRRSVERQHRLEEIYYNDAKEIVSKEMQSNLQNFTDNKQTLTDKYFLYFTQLGMDMYTGNKINIDNIGNYQIDHILPQAFIKDDSIDNRVLVSSAINNGKSDNVPLNMYASIRVKNDVQNEWKNLAEHGLISQRKLNNLMTDPESIDKYKAHGFIKRQLVETSQVIRLVAEILNDKYHGETEIIEVRAKMNSQLRKDFDLIKNRNVNDYHHALDAYLTTFIGNYLYRRYPKLRSYFTYGHFKKIDDMQLKQFNFLRDIENDKKANYINDNGELLWSRERDIAYFKKIYNFKYMLVSHEVSTRQGAMFKQTIFPAAADAKSKLIPIKNDKPTAIYGGYSNNNDAYLAIIKLAKTGQFKVVGVPQRAIVKLKQAYDKGLGDYSNVLYKVLEPKFTKKKVNRKTGEITYQVEKFEIVVPKVSYRQLVIDGDQKFMLGSSTYKYNAKQLVLSENAIKILDKKSFDQSGYKSSDLDAVYDEILSQVDRYFSLYDTNKFRQKLHDGRKQFVNLPNENLFDGKKLKQNGKREILNEIMNGLHANATMGYLKAIGFATTPLGQLQSPSGIELSQDAVVCYQSPTGIFERRVALKDL
jgi:CRISPR-associated endonuclease Csn1